MGLIWWTIKYRIRNLFRLKWRQQELRDMVDNYRCLYVHCASVQHGLSTRYYNYGGISLSHRIDPRNEKYNYILRKLKLDKSKVEKIYMRYDKQGRKVVDVHYDGRIYIYGL